MLIPRNRKTGIITVARDTPVIMINGARQTGKASSTIKPDTFKGLKALKELVGNKFHRGVVLYLVPM
jgi:hypothetical protein